MPDSSTNAASVKNCRRKVLIKHVFICNILNIKNNSDSAEFGQIVVIPCVQGTCGISVQLMHKLIHR